MHQCVDIVVDNSHSQDTANAQEKHHRILTMFGQLFPVNPAKHIYNIVKLTVYDRK